MPQPKVLDRLYQAVTTSDEEEALYEGSLPINADTLSGHPVEYFASKTEVNQIMMNYMSTILGKSY